jgi:hypothetical protein
MVGVKNIIYAGNDLWETAVSHGNLKTVEYVVNKKEFDVNFVQFYGLLLLGSDRGEWSNFTHWLLYHYGNSPKHRADRLLDITAHLDISEKKKTFDPARIQTTVLQFPHPYYNQDSFSAMLSMYLQYIYLTNGRGSVIRSV